MDMDKENEKEIEILGKFLGVDIEGQKSEILSSFQELVLLSSNEINKRDVDDQLFHLINDLMHQVFSELENSDDAKWDILFEIFCYIMNLMSESRTNQDRVKSTGHFISFIHENFYAKARIGWSHAKYPKWHFIKILRVCLQLTGNYLIQNRANIKDYFNIDEGLKSLRDMLNYSDDGVKKYSLINLHCIMKISPVMTNRFLDKSSIEAILENVNLDVHYEKVLWLLIRDSVGSKQLIEQLRGTQKKTKILFFKALSRNNSEKMSSLPDQAIDYILQEFAEYADAAMINDKSDIYNGGALVETIEIFITITREEIQDSKIKFRKDDKLVLTSIKLLNSFHVDTRPKRAKEKQIINKIRVLLLKLYCNFNFDIPSVFKRAKENSLSLILLEIYNRESVNDDKNERKEYCSLVMDALKHMKKSQQADVNIKEAIKSRPDFSDIKEFMILLK